jgi:hypothetical protein
MIVVSKVESDTKKGVFYTVKIADGYNFCSCRDFLFHKFDKGTCKHIDRERDKLKKGVEFRKPVMTERIRQLYQATNWFIKKYRAKMLYDYIDLYNSNFIGKKVGNIVEIKKKKFFISFRPKGFSYSVGQMILTGMNSSEIFWQKQHDIDRVVIFKLPTGELKAYRFNINKVWEYFSRQPNMKLEFKEFPNENEPVVNIPMSIAQDFDEWLSIQDTKVAMCSKCKRKGSEDNSLWVFGDDENRISRCCGAKVLLVKREN